MAHSETDQMADIRVPISVGIVLQAIIAAAYIIPIESDPALSTESRFRFLEAVLYLSPLLTLALYHWRPQVGRWFAVLAPAVIVFALQSWLPIPGSLALLAIATGLAAALIGTRAAVGVATASVLGLVALRTADRRPRRLADRDRSHCYRDYAVLTLSVQRTVVDAAAWSRSYYLQAVRIMQENRAARARCSRRWKTWRMPTGR